MSLVIVLVQASAQLMNVVSSDQSSALGGCTSDPFSGELRNARGITCGA
jgi:hypothetical protein